MVETREICGKERFFFFLFILKKSQLKPSEIFGVLFFLGGGGGGLLWRNKFSVFFWKLVDGNYQNFVD